MRPPPESDFNRIVEVAAPVVSPPGDRWSLERVFRLVAGIGGLGAVFWLVWYFSGLVTYLVVGLVLAYLVRPLVDRFQGFGIGRIAAILVTFVLFFGGISLLVTYLVPFMGGQLNEFSQLVSAESFDSAAMAIESWLTQFIPLQEGDVQRAVNDSIQTLFQGDQITQIAGSVVEVFTDIFYAVLVIPFVMFFVLKDGTSLRRSLLHLVPNRYYEVTLAVVEKVETNVGRYFRGLMVQSISIAAVASIGLSIAGIEYAIAVGIFAGLANTIPYFGPLMGFLAGTLVGVAQTGNFSLVLGVLIAMSITQIADNVFFQPLIFSRAAQTHPLLILFVVLIGAQLGGIIGMLLAIPLLTIVRVVAQEVRWSLRNYKILKYSS